MNVIRESIYYKLRTYTLNLNHKDGGPKAQWFSKALGFTLNNLEDLERQIDFDEGESLLVRSNKVGEVYLYHITLRGANGRIIHGVKTFWIKEYKTGSIRFTNILPSKLKVVK